MEYGAPLSYAFKQFKNSKDLFDPIQRVQNEAIAWIFNSNISKMKVLEGIIGALTVEQRFRHLRCNFQLHLDRSASSNPIRPLIQKSRQFQYLFTLKSDPLYDQFRKIPDLPVSNKQIKNRMSSFLLSERSQILSLSKSILVNYIPLTARTPGLVDKVFTAPIQFQRKFLSWRYGSLFIQQICVCGERWHRRHISCLPKPELTSEHCIRFIECQKEQSTNFSELDYLLNRQEWKLAYELIRSWQGILDSVKKSNE